MNGKIFRKHWKKQYFNGIIYLLKRKDFHSMPNTEELYKAHIKELEQQILLLKEQVDL